MQFQRFFDLMNKISLIGMNIGTGSGYRDSGELEMVKNISSKYLHKKKSIIFDIGANIGEYSKSLSTIFPTANIFSFEPSPVTFLELQKNTKGYLNITPVNVGFSDKIENRFLYSDEEKSGLASIYNRRLDHLKIKFNRKEKIKLITIDDYCKKNNIKRISFLKIDAEGNEYRILQGASNMIKSRKIDYIQFEFGGCNIDSKTFIQDFYYLLGNDYKFYRIVKNGIYPLGLYKERYECFVTTNYLAELKK